VADAVEGKTHALGTLADGLQREIEGLLLRCKSLERSIQVLKKEGNWTYSAPDVPRSHWVNEAQGHDEDYAEEAEDLIQSIKEGTEDLRSDGGDEVYVSCDTLILSDNALNPHWEQLANAMQLSERIKYLHLDEVQLDKRTIQMIEASVRQKGITGIHLSLNQFHGGEGVQFASNVLKSNISVKTFIWTWNPFHSTEEACDLVDAFLEHPNIETLVLTRSLNAGGITPYTPVKRLFDRIGNGALLSVNLSVNGINTNGDRCIPNFLSANPSLERLYLMHNQLTDDDALHIGLALQSNSNLRFLDLHDNALTQGGGGVMYLHSVLGYSRSDISPELESSEVNLNTVSGANHTCEIVGILSEEFVQEIFMNDSDKSAKWNRRRKLFALLFGRHRKGSSVSQLESEFSEDSMGLVPHVLACINTYSEDGCNRCLSILFDLVRNWKTPEIFQPRQV